LFGGKGIAAPKDTPEEEVLNILKKASLQSR
jgi:hypothetical protein